MRCEYRCHEVGGPWIAENPVCPVHGLDAQAEDNRRSSVKEELQQRIADARTLEELRYCLYDMLELI